MLTDCYYYFRTEQLNVVVVDVADVSASTEKHLKRKIELAFIVPAQQQKRQQQKSVDSVSWTLIWQRKHTKTPPENYWFVVEVDSCLLFECVRFVSLHELCFKKTSLWCVSIGVS